eukprot:XP_001706326.1 Hypothetical protein GL50803_36158 [Giardia lamblia ATCC 50803]
MHDPSSRAYVSRTRQRIGHNERSRAHIIPGVRDLSHSMGRLGVSHVL